MAITEGLISGFDQARTKYRDAEIAKAKADQDRQFSILQALALHTDPELAKVGAAGLLNLASSGSPRTGKGLSGFLGEVDKSDYMAPLQALFGGSSPVSATTGTTAAQPNSAAVDPERVANGPGIADRVTPPTMGGNPAEEQVGARVSAPTFGAETPESPLGGTEPPAFGAPGMGAPMMPQGPPPPETPQGRAKRLYPTAGEIAADTASKTLQARIQAVFEGLRAAKTPDEQDIVRGLAGAPRRQSAAKVMNARYMGADGQEVEGAVVWDAIEQQATVDGQPVTVTKLMPINPPRPYVTSTAVGDGTYSKTAISPDTGQPLWQLKTGMPVPTAPAEYSGTATVNGKVVRLPRGGGAPEVLGDAPQAAGMLTPEQAEATGWLTDVNAEVKAALAKANANVFVSSQKKTALPTAQQNAIVKQVTKGRYQTLGELTTATKRQVGTGTSGAEGSRRDLGNRVRQRLEKNDPSTIQGPGLPQ